MTAVEVREKLRKFFFKLNRKQMVALSEVIADSGSGNNNSGGIDTSDITEINDSNIQQVLKAASSIIVKGGFDANKEISAGEVPFMEFLLFVRTCDNNLIPLPVNYMDTFARAGIPFICIEEYYGTNDAASPLLNVDGDSIIISDTQVNYISSINSPCMISPSGPNCYDISMITGPSRMVRTVDNRTVPVIAGMTYTNYVQDPSCSNKLTESGDHTIPTIDPTGPDQ